MGKNKQVLKCIEKGLQKASFTKQNLYKHKLDKIIKAFMETHNIPHIEIKGNSVIAVQPMNCADKQFWIESWLEGEISPQRITELITTVRHNNVHYTLKDFLELLKNG